MHMPIILPFFRDFGCEFHKKYLSGLCFFHPIHENRFALKNVDAAI